MCLEIDLTSARIKISEFLIHYNYNVLIKQYTMWFNKNIRKWIQIRISHYSIIFAEKRNCFEIMLIFHRPFFPEYEFMVKFSKTLYFCLVYLLIAPKKPPLNHNFCLKSFLCEIAENANTAKTTTKVKMFVSNNVSKFLKSSFINFVRSRLVMYLFLGILVTDFSWTYFELF